MELDSFCYEDRGERTGEGYFSPKTGDFAVVASLAGKPETGIVILRGKMVPYGRPEKAHWKQVSEAVDRWDWPKLKTSFTVSGPGELLEGPNAPHEAADVLVDAENTADFDQVLACFRDLSAPPRGSRRL